MRLDRPLVFILVSFNREAEIGSALETAMEAIWIGGVTFFGRDFAGQRRTRQKGPEESENHHVLAAQVVRAARAVAVAAAEPDCWM